MKVNRKSIEFFMIVTNRSIFIADYCIKSYKSVINKLKIDYSVTLRVFLNCIDDYKYLELIDKWKKIDYVKIEYSHFVKTDFIDNNGGYINLLNKKKYSMPMLTPEESWDLGLRSSTSDFFVTVDDDFEILKGKFVICMFDYLEKNKNIHILSVDKTIRHTYYDTYSKQIINARERNDTWFCIYRKFNSKTLSHKVVDYFIDVYGKEVHFDFECQNSEWNEYINKVKQNEATREVWDAAGWMQKSLRELYHSNGIICLNDINPTLKNTYVHYAAYSKNKSIDTPFKTAIYRYLFIKKSIGYSILPSKLNIFVKKIHNQIFKLLFLHIMNERQFDNSRSKLD